MKITFIGSSHGYPEPNRKCSCIMIQVEENIYFIDMGTPAIDALVNRGLPVENVKGIFFTHMHGDHTCGLIPFVYLSTLYYRQTDPVIFMPILEAPKVIDDWMRVTLKGASKEFQYRLTLPGLLFDDGIIRVTAIPTMHCEKSYGYLVEAEGKSVLFTGDMMNPEVDFPKVAFERPLDLIICEAAHFYATDYLPVFEKCNVSKIIVTHYSNRFLPSVLEIQKELTERGLPLELATDDKEIRL